MNYKVGQKIRIKTNACDIIEKYNKTSNFKLKIEAKRKYEGTIQTINFTHVSMFPNCIAIYAEGSDVFPIEAIELYDTERQEMLDIEKSL